MRRPTRLGQILAIAGCNLRRLVRYRANIFFIVILPLMLILLLGTAFGDRAQTAIAVYDGARSAHSRAVVEALTATDSVVVARADSESAVIESVSRGRSKTGLVLRKAPPGSALVARYVAQRDSAMPQVMLTVRAALAGVDAQLRAAQFAQQVAGISEERATTQAQALLRAPPSLTVTVTAVAEDQATSKGTRVGADTRVDAFAAGAASQLLLFIFLTSLLGAVAVIETGQRGVFHRMLCAPMSATTLVIGEMLGRYAVAVVQGVIIIAGAWLFFATHWGNLAAAMAIMAVFSLVAAGAAMLLASVLANAEQASAVGLLLGLGGAALGGCMVPLEFFPETLATMAHITPHAWGNRAFTALMQRGAGIGDIAVELTVLSLYGAGLILLAARLLRRRIMGGSI